MRALSLLSLLLCGCHTYTRVETGIPAPGTSLRVELTDRGADNLAAQIGPRAVRVDGRVVEADTSSVTMALTAIERVNGQLELWGGERVTFPETSVGRVLREQFSWRRTTLLVTGGVAAIVLIFNGAGGWEGLGGGKNGPPPTGS